MSVALEQLRAVVPPDACLVDADAVDAYATDWNGRPPDSDALAVLLPKTTAQVAQILQICDEHRIGVVPQGGRTGMVSGATPTAGSKPVLLNLSRMNQVREVDAAEYELIAEAGCVLADVQQAAADQGRLFPLSLAAEGTCQIGGNIATNAGGINVYRYGMMRNMVLGLEVVLPGGRVIDGLREPIKNNEGYDLKHLFLGSEGTLGVVTAARFRLYPAAKSEAWAVVAARDLDAVLALLRHAQTHVGDVLTVFELIPQNALARVLERVPNTKAPLDQLYGQHVLVQLSSPEAGAALDERLLSVLESAAEDECIEDAAVAQDARQAREFLALREGIPEALRNKGAQLKFDVSTRRSTLPRFVEEADVVVQSIVPGATVFAFGHVADGNLHYEVHAPGAMSNESFADVVPALMSAVHDVIQAHGGSISAEHGIGRSRREEYERLADPVGLSVMRGIKSAFDPNGIMNPGKVL